MKLILYGVIVAAYFTAGCLDLADGETKLGTVAICFGIVNVMIFFWR